MMQLSYAVILELLLSGVGLFFTILLFGRLQLIGKSIDSSLTASEGLSIIIPARNEAKSLPLLLGDLMRQNIRLDEVLVVDDMSEDETAEVAEPFGVRLIKIHDKPEGWTGKSYACQCGADASTGSRLLFLDADVRLSPEAISMLLSAQARTGRVVSIQPYHTTQRPYEQLSMFFNLVQVAANGLGLLFGRTHVGLSGPVILINKDDYDKAGGHEAVRDSITEDVSLGQALSAQGIGYDVYLGTTDIAFRMYGQGLQLLLSGWTKNFATGALKMPIALLLAVFIWVTSCISVPYHLICSIFSPFDPIIYIYIGFYVVWAAVLLLLSRQIGRFSIWAVILYPVPLLVFTAVFLVSLFKKVFGLKVTWKGRKIKLRT